MGEVGQLLAGLVHGLFRRDLVRMAVLGVIVLVDGSGDLRRGMVLTRPAKQHRRGRQALQGDSGHDQPSEEQSKAVHDPADSTETCPACGRKTRLRTFTGVFLPP